MFNTQKLESAKGCSLFLKLDLKNQNNMSFRSTFDDNFECVNLQCVNLHPNLQCVNLHPNHNQLSIETYI